MNKVHYHLGSKYMGDTLCGRMVDFTSIMGNLDKPVSCKTCKKLHKKRMKNVT